MSSVANRIWWPGRIGRAQNCAISKRRLMELEHLQAAQISLSPFQSTKSVCLSVLAGSGGGSVYFLASSRKKFKKSKFQMEHGESNYCAGREGREWLLL